MSGFASELKAARETAPAPEASTDVDASEDSADAGLASHMAEGHDFANGLPVGSKAVNQEVANAAPREPDVADERPKIKIGAKEFHSLEEAHQYAEELERARIELQGTVDGYKMAKEQDAKPAAEVAKQEKVLEDEVEALLFENPKEALRIFKAGLKKEFDADLEVKSQVENQAKQVAATREATWNEFYAENTDLAESKDYVDFMLAKNPALLDKPKSDALKELAELARKGLRITKQAALPRKELHSGHAITAGGSSSATQSAQVVTEPQEMDFVEHLKQLRKRK